MKEEAACLSWPASAGRIHNQLSYSETILKRFTQFLLCGLVAAMPGLAAAQFPQKPITIVVPFSPGAISDTVARLVAEKMSASLGQQVIVENKPGAAGMIGANQVARAQPDGHQILLGSNSTNAINKSLYRNMAYDLEKDFAPISMAGEIPAVMIARGDLPVDNLAQLIEYGKKNPGRLSFAFGNTTGQITGETLNHKVEGLQAIIVPYKSEPLGITDVLGGQVDLMSLNLPVAYPYIKSGKVKALALPGASRVDALPGVARASDTVTDMAIPNGWLAFFAPAGTPEPVVAKLNASIVQALTAKDVEDKLRASGGYIVRSSSPQDLAGLVRRDVATWAELIKAAQIPMQ